MGAILAFAAGTLAPAAGHAGETSAHLVDRAGRAVYVLDGAACTGPCALLWPAVPAADAPAMPDARLAGTVALADGTEAATYAGKPLHYFAEDVLPGEANGHRFREFGTIGHLVTPSGRALGGQVAAGTDNDDDAACGCGAAPENVSAGFAIAFAGAGRSGDNKNPVLARITP